MSIIVLAAVGIVVVLWVLWNVFYLAAHGREEVRFFEVSTGRWGE